MDKEQHKSEALKHLLGYGNISCGHLVQFCICKVIFLFCKILFAETIGNLFTFQNQHFYRQLTGKALLYHTFLKTIDNSGHCEQVKLHSTLKIVCKILLAEIIWIFFSKLALIEVAYWQGLAVSHFFDKIWQFWSL